MVYFIVYRVFVLNFLKELITFTNLRIQKHNTDINSNRRMVQPISDKELKMVIAILIIGKQEKGSMDFHIWFKNRLLSQLNMFSEIGGISSANIDFLSCSRFYQVLRFLTPGALEYVPRQAWKKSSAVRHQPFGGFFENLTGRVLNLNVLFDRYVSNFNESSRSVYLPSGILTIDEILSKSKSRKNPVKQFNATKRDKIGILWHVMMDSESKFCVKARIKLSKQFTPHELFKTEGLVLDFVDDFRGSFARICQDNYFNSFSLSSKFNDLGIYVYGTCRKMIISRHFSDHADGLNSYIDSKHSKVHSLKCFTHHEYDHVTRGKIHIMIYNSPGRNSCIFISNSNDVVGKSTEISTPEKDYRSFHGGHFSRELPTKNSRPKIAQFYNSEMNACDVFDQYIHHHTIRYIPMKNRLSWILKPTLSIIDYELLNTFFIQKESGQNPECDFRLFLLKVAQGLLEGCLKPENAPLRVGEHDVYSRKSCQECRDQDPKRDSRTSKFCIKCKSACCKAHSYSICKNCL